MSYPRDVVDNQPVPSGAVFRLYVAGEAPNSGLAMRNLQALCQANYGSDFSIEVVDVLLSPERAWQEGVIATPTVIRLSPPPAVQLIGNLSDGEQVRRALGLHA